MLKKEFFDAFKKFMECMILLLGIPLGVVFDKLIIHYGWKLSEIFNFVFLATIIAYPLAAGLTIFLLRFKIIMYKIAPRFFFFAAVDHRFNFLFNIRQHLDKWIQPDSHIFYLVFPQYFGQFICNRSYSGFLFFLWLLSSF